MESVTQIQIINEVICVVLDVNAFKEGINTSLLHPAIGKQLGRLDEAPVLNIWVE